MGSKIRLVTKHDHSVQNHRCQMIFFECKLICSSFSAGFRIIMLKSLETDNDEDEHLPVKPNYKTHPKITTDLELLSRLSLKKCCDL